MGRILFIPLDYFSYFCLPLINIICESLTVDKHSQYSNTAVENIEQQKLCTKEDNEQ